MSITFDTKGEDDMADASDKIEDLVCVVYALNIPDAIVSQMENTNSLAGMQDVTWDTFTATWAYHPDNGMFLTVIDEG
jgi:hypothetical protein